MSPAVRGLLLEEGLGVSYVAVARVRRGASPVVPATAAGSRLGRQFDANCGIPRPTVSKIG